jgi:metallo-beta-lactamase family protein
MKFIHSLCWLAILLPAAWSPAATDSPPAASTLEYTSYGAGRCVSGSLHLINLDGDLLILDAGQFMGNDGDGAPRFPTEELPRIPAIILSHVHADHSGRILEVVNNGFRGKIYCSLPTRELMDVMLTMSARYSDLGREKFYYSRNSYRENKRQGKGTTAHLYPECPWGEQIKEAGTVSCSRTDLEDRGFYMCRDCARIEVEKVLDMIEVVWPGKSYRITPRLTADFYYTPHLPGSLMTRVSNPLTGDSLLFTGDFGSGLSPFLSGQDRVESATWAIIEGTYGPVEREREPRETFRKFVGEKVREGKRVIIPSFVLDRAQQVLHDISLGIREGHIPENQKVKIFSPSIEDINRIYSKNFLDPRFSTFLADDYRARGPFDDIAVIPPQGNEDVGYGEIASCSSGMADAGFAKEFVKRWVGDPRTVFIFVGYQSPLTVGGKLTRLGKTEEFVLKDGSVISGVVERENVSALLLETESGRRTVPRASIARRRPGTTSVTIDGQTYPVRAEIRKMGSFSGHGTPNQIRDFLSGIEGLKDVLIVHADPDVIHLLGAYYRNELPDINFHIPRMGEKITLGSDLHK